MIRRVISWHWDCGEMNMSDLAGIEAQFSKANMRTDRLVRQDQFQLVRSNGVSAAGQYCVVNILRKPPDNMSRAAFSISRRFSKLAVERNRARRLFREVYRIVSDELSGCWVIFIPRHRMKGRKLSDVLEDARGCISRIP